MEKKNDTAFKSTAKRVEDASVKKQEATARKIEEKQKEAKEKALKEKKKLEKKEETKKKESIHIDKKTEKLVEEGLMAAAGGIVAAAQSKSGFVKGMIVGAIAGILLTSLVGFTFKDKIFGKIETTKDKADQIISENFFGFTAADFEDAILGAASEHQELIVMEQPLSIPTTITKAGLGDLAIFSKVKSVTYYGTGVYTVDMSKIDKDHITVDEKKQKVTIEIPHASLQYVNYDIEKTEFEDTKKGLLSFGDITLTQEQQNDLEKEINDAMRKELNRKDLFHQADSYAKLKVWEIFQPVISAVSPVYILEIIIK